MIAPTQVQMCVFTCISTINYFTDFSTSGTGVVVYSYIKVTRINSPSGTPQLGLHAR